jgi:hypothetical protein
MVLEKIGRESETLLLTEKEFKSTTLLTVEN